MSAPSYIGAIDQGTTSTRFIVFDKQGAIVSSMQFEHKQFYPHPGWVEHDPIEIWEKTSRAISGVLSKSGISPESLAAIGITNQRETIVAWNRYTGKPYHNALVWQDTRTANDVERLTASCGPDCYREKTGLPVATYFSATKIRWMLEHVPGLEAAAESGDAVFGTIDSWILYNLTGGARNGIVATEVTNASRTLLMDIRNLSWDEELLSDFSVPRSSLPAIKPSVPQEPFGYTDPSGPFSASIPITGILGDQQSALFGQACFEAGMSKNTYGTGCFMLMNTGEKLVHSKHGLLSTVASQIGNAKPQYALEGSVAIAGALVQWFRDNLGLIKASKDIEALAARVEDSGDVYIVPAFSGLFAPYWRPDARGVIVGLTGYANASHLARAVLEATAFQTKDMFDAMEKDAGLSIPSVRVDGGMVVNELLMQFQADILDRPILRPKVTETTALGAAYAAGLGCGFFKNQEELAEHWAQGKQWLSCMAEAERERRLHYWKKAVERTLSWVEQG